MAHFIVALAAEKEPHRMVLLHLEATMMKACFGVHPEPVLGMVWKTSHSLLTNYPTEPEHARTAQARSAAAKAGRCHGER